MTTITIENGLKKEYSCKSSIEAIEALLDDSGYVLLSPIEDLEISARIQVHAHENKDRSVDTYDNI